MGREVEMVAVRPISEKKGSIFGDVAPGVCVLNLW